MELTNRQEFFDNSYYEIFQKSNNTELETNFLIEVMKLKQEDEILDVGCGNARHLLMLANQGYNNLTGIDLAQNLIDMGKSKDPSLNLVCSDFQKYNFSKNGFNKIWSFFSGFGYFSEKENMGIISKISGLLDKGGYFLLDIYNYHSFIRNFKSKYEKEVDNIKIININKFDPINNIYYSKNIIGDKEYEFKMRLYCPTEIISILAQNGLKLLRMYGDYDQSAFTIESKRAIYLFEK